MLNIIFGREGYEDKDEFVLDTRIYFSRNKEPEWFEDDFVKKFLMGVDGTTVLFEEVLKGKFGHGISTEMMSTGCRTLCGIYYNEDPDLIFYGSAMGNNCVPYLMEMARTKDITIILEHYMEIPVEYLEEGIVWCDGKCLREEYDFDDAYSDWCHKMYLLEEEE